MSPKVTKKINQKTTIEELAAFVCEALTAQGIEVVLTGGAVVSIYSENEYESFDLDFVLLGLGKNVDGVMKQLGFKKEKGRHYIHPNTAYFVEFPGNTLAIGDSLDTEIVDRKTKSGTIRLLSPTDCVKDRLAAYYHWNDRQGLNQGIMVAKRHPISIEKVRKWSRTEGFTDKFQEFLTKLRESIKDKSR